MTSYLVQCVPERHVHSDSVCCGLGSSSLTRGALANIASTAARGMASVSVTSTVEQLLTLKPVLLSAPGDDRQVLDDVNSRLLPCMVALDLACAASTSLQSSNTLLDLALKQVPAELRHMMTTTSSHAADQSAAALKHSRPSAAAAGSDSSCKLDEPFNGVLTFLNNMAAYVNELSVQRQASSDVSSVTSQQCIVGLSKALTTGVISLDATVVKQYIRFSDEFERLASKVTTSGLF